MKLTTELFLIPDGAHYIVYAPLKRVLFRGSAELVNLLARIGRGRNGVSASDHPALAMLMAQGIIDGPPDPAPAMPVKGQYKPTRVTLFLTSRCNLGCRYCYASANSKKIDMPEQLGRDALEYAARNCVEMKMSHLSVGFHGGGEPTQAWDLLVALTAHAREIAVRHGLKLAAGIATNGCVSSAQAKWLAANMNMTTLSLDGPPSIQDAQRPFPDGSPSSPVIRNMLRIFHRDGGQYSIQSTFTRETVARMPEAVRYFARHTRPKMVKFEPVCNAGRYRHHRGLVPDPLEFGRYYNQAHEVAVEKKLALTFSGIRLWGNPVQHFCGAFIEPFTITPDGCVTACYEACSRDNPLAGIFIIGRHVPADHDFKISMGALNRLRRRNNTNLKPCRNCFCKYSCAGDCATRNIHTFATNDLAVTGARCGAIREITRHRLANYIDAAMRKDSANEPR